MFCSIGGASSFALPIKSIIRATLSIPKHVLSNLSYSSSSDWNEISEPFFANRQGDIQKA